MLKGHTKIELFDAETGERQHVYEQDNLVTNAIEHLINYKAACAANVEDDLFPIHSRALGGLLLFDNNLAEDADNVCFPGKGVHLVGYAGQGTGTMTKQGSYNAVESHENSDGFTSVWDFGTSQANGVIKAIARTSATAGSNPLRNCYYFGNTKRYGVTDRDGYWYPIVFKDNYMYCFKMGSDHAMRVLKARMPVFEHKVMDWRQRFEAAETIATFNTQSYHWQEVRYGMTYDYYRYAEDYMMYYDGGDGYLYVITSTESDGNSSGSAKIAYFTIKYLDESFEKSEPQTITIPNALLSSYNSGCVQLTNGKLFWKHYNSKGFYIIDFNNPVNVSLVTIFANSDYIYSHKCTRFYIDGAILFYTVHYKDKGSDRRMGILYQDGTFWVQDYGTAEDWDSYHNLWCHPDRLVFPDYYPSGYYWMSLSMQANYLGTIQNLSSQIVKNASQTMKVTYTLTDVPDGEEGDGNA